MIIDDRIGPLDEMSCELANLYVASHQILGNLSRDAVLSAIEDILVTLVGSEEFAIFEQREPGASPVLLASSGIEPLRHATLGTPSRMMQEALERGTLGVRRRDREGDADDPLEACIPLKAGDRVVGVIVIYRLLSHKTAFEKLDLELFELLATRAGAALVSSGLREDAARSSKVRR